MQLETQELRTEFDKFLIKQAELERGFCNINKKLNGTFLTNNSVIIDSILESIPSNTSIFSKMFLEPSCGQGVFLIKLILKAYLTCRESNVIAKFIEKNLFFVDINPQLLEATKNNISDLYFYLFKKRYFGKFNAYCQDFTKIESNLPLFENIDFSQLYGKFDFVLGNPPYITLYGRRDKKKNEEQRVYYLKHYKQFPNDLKNGKINYVMLFIEQGLKFLKKNGTLSFIIDLSFFETAYQYCRKFLVQNYTIRTFYYNLKGFQGVASGQIILEVSNTPPKKNTVRIFDAETRNISFIEQENWNKPEDEFKFRISCCEESDNIIKSIFEKRDPTLQELYPKKNLRTCTMLLNMEDHFTGRNEVTSIRSYPYYRGSNGLKYKYSKLHHEKYFYYDKPLQDKINDNLKEELTLKGIKNKKRIGLGEVMIYDNPKIYIRQSAKELIATYDENPSSANNSLYVFSLRNNSENTIRFLKYLCGLINSKIYTFFAQKRRIIRYNKGKQPQIKISDLYQIFIPNDKELRNRLISLVDDIYCKTSTSEKYRTEIDKLLYEYYQLSCDEIKLVENSIEEFLQ